MTAAAPVRVDALAPEVSPAESYDLVRSLDELGGLLLETLAGGFRLDAFLVAAGMHQIVADALHPDPFRLDEAASFLGSTPVGRLVRLAGSLAQRARQPFFGRGLLECERELAEIVGELAEEGPVDPELLRRAAAVVESLESLPARVRGTVLRLHACFHDFDQRPEDVARLARGLAMHFGDRSRRLLVVGVRTSGSYLAPLQAACLRREGFVRVDVVTARPGRRLLRAERRLVRDVRRDGGLALIVDDPPGTGGSLRRVIGELGLPGASVVLLLQLFDGQELPPALSDYAAVCLPWREWHIHSRLRPPGAAEALLVPGGAGRGHARGLFRVGDRIVFASGVGLGYLGSTAPAIGRALPELLPGILGIADGVLWREWLPEERRAAHPAPGAIAAYVSRRADALPLREDFSLHLTGEFPAWEVAANVLTRAFGRAGPAIKLLGVDAAARRLLHVKRPSLADGWTDAAQWFEPALKVGFYERSYWHLGLASADPVHDLAGAAAGRDDEFVEALLRAYPEPVDAERFVLSELAHLWCRGRLHPEDVPEVRRAQGAALRRYVFRRFLAGARVAPGGPVCALDLDGVLETEHLGFPSTTRSGALALRALVRHGFRPVIASGRSATDVAERCAGYGLPGGVAEYGGAIVVGGTVRSLLTGEEAAALERVRAELAGADLDPLYRHSVRARGLDEQTVERVLAAGDVRAIRGEGQVDFVPVGVDKATGLRVLLAELGAETLAFAVGDTAADLPMLELAVGAAAPGHASGALRGVRVRRPYQAGLAQAVEGLLGHAPGGCPDCRVELDERAELLLTILSAQERGPLGIAGAALRLRRRT